MFLCVHVGCQPDPSLQCSPHPVGVGHLGEAVGHGGSAAERVVDGVQGRHEGGQLGQGYELC